MDRLKGKVALISGGAEGLGEAIARAFVREGARVMLGDVQVDKAKALARALGDAADAMLLDVTLPESWEAAVEGTLRSFGKLNILVNNAGISEPGGVSEVSKESWSRTMRINLDGVFHGTQAALPAMVAAAESGAVVNMSSGGMYNSPLAIGAMDAKKAEGYNGIRAYAVHKRGQAALTSYWSEVYGASSGLTFYVMHPGWADTQGVKTSLPRFRRILLWVLRTPAQGADTAIWLGATRPQGTDPAGFWLDGATRSAHASEFTRKSKHRPVDLANYLKGASAMPAP